MENITETLEGLGRQVQYFPELARCLGDVKAAIFLGQLLYWWSKRSGDGIYKTAEEWEEETGLSEKEQRRAREILKRFQILTDEYRRLEHRMHYFLNEEMLDKVWNEFSRTDKRDVPELTTGQFGKDPNGSSSINTKLQQEITTLDTSEPTASLAAPKKKDPSVKITKYILKTFTDHTPITSPEYPREGAAAKRIAKIVLEMEPQFPQEATEALLSHFLYLTEHGWSFLAFAALQSLCARYRRNSQQSHP